MTAAARRSRAGLERRLPSASSVQKVMASPPSVTVTTSATITTPRYWPLASDDAASFRAIGSNFATISGASKLDRKGSSYPDNSYLAGKSVNNGTVASPSGGQVILKTSVIVTDSAMEIYWKGSASAYALIKVDDEYITLTPYTMASGGAGSPNYIYIPFGSRKPRRVDILGNSQFNPGFILTSQSGSVIAAPSRGPRTLVIGDSIPAGTGTASGFGWPIYFADIVGIDDLFLNCVGGTGYVADNGGTKTKALDRLADALSCNPDLIIWDLGINDRGYIAQLTAAALACYQFAAAVSPNAVQIALASSKEKGPGGVILAAYQVDAAIKAAATAAGILYRDPSEMPLPIGYVPDTVALNSAYSSGTTLSCVTRPVLGGVYKWPDGTKFQVRSISGSVPFSVTVDAVQGTHAAGEMATQCGNSYNTGVGKVGATTGWGNQDVNRSNDGTHPNDVGQFDQAWAVAESVYGRAA